MSTNEELQPPPKPRQSPLDFRNTDLVSRLLAATPPYLYNMPLVPNSYFFSEMLRSFVQAKTDHHSPTRTQTRTTTLPSSTASSNYHQHHQQRRSRKRSWNQAAATNIPHHNYQQHLQQQQQQQQQSLAGKESIAVKPEVPMPNWHHPHHHKVSASPPRSVVEKREAPLSIETKRRLEALPLELSLSKPYENKVKLSPGGSSTTCSNTSMRGSNTETPNTSPTPQLEKSQSMEANTTTSQSFPLMFPNLPQSSEQNQNLILPPPPPMWYPPLYPTPYGIDPLHFFIDLRVSGHIYDRKNGANAKPETSPANPTTSLVNTQELTSSSSIIEPSHDVFRPSRHASAFSVPTPSALTRNLPINLSNTLKHELEPPAKEPKFRFDVNSMVFNNNNNNNTTVSNSRASNNRTSTNYVLRNINTIYKDMNDHSTQSTSDQSYNYCKTEFSVDHQSNLDRKMESSTGPVESSNGGVNEDVNVDDAEGSNDEQKVKRVKQLKALFGLELVVDYMSKKPGVHQEGQVMSEESTTSDNDSALEVVDVNDEDSLL